ncbi:MAG: hypothetical protein M0D53_14130 [Flavobacterium sp. JAD_PAG50586_2]|nr:MAG: hypothetical protein M0D53_14130 [Flavobacterium sp. JAD_PAG50586_2]
MTYKEKLQELYDDYASKSQALLKLDKELVEADGFSELNLIPDYQIAYIDFQMAHNNFYNLFTYVRDNNIPYPSEYQPR